MSEQAASPQDVHALIVGIETYAFGPRWTLPGPSDDALRFRSWLIDRGVPDVNIALHLAPTPGHAPDLPYRPCDHWALRRALVQDLPMASSRLLWVFWGGHGYLDREGHLRLLTADASERDPVNIDLDDALAYYNSIAVPHHLQQTWIVDACATFEQEMYLAVAPPTEILPRAQAANQARQVHLHAAGRGRRTPNLPIERTGRFSSLVMEHLNRRADAVTPVDTAFLDAIERDARAADGHGSPIWTRLRDPGRERVFGSATSCAGQSHSAQSVTDVTALINTLCARPWASDPDTRQNLVDALPRRLGEQVPRSRSPRSDLVGIVLHLRKIDGGLDALRGAMEIIDSSS
ncbi:caspase family protein [Streptomyces sp. NPDC058954]|uniref:effector-associated domain 2-containing protein n=1 Tax=Streptomyces sp. NPDC058954 TaxID=3346677 RepID=UPI00367EF43E